MASPYISCGLRQGSQGADAANKEAWLASWEERLKQRERVLVEAGFSFPRYRGTPVLKISCASCNHHLSSQGMQVCYNTDTSADAYTADRSPNGIKKCDRDMEHNLCGCRVRQFECVCGSVVGHHIHYFCNGCSGHSDEGHRWHFYFQSVEAEPRRDMSTGEMLMWPGSEAQEDEESSVDDIRGQIFDENSMVHQDTDTTSWTCSPLMDRNGRQRQASLGKPCAGRTSWSNAPREAELARREAALRAREDDLLKREEAQFEAELNQGAREKFLRDATAQQEHGDKELATRSAALNQRTAMIEARERQLEEQVQQFLSDKANKDCKRAVERAERKAAICEAEVDALRVQITEQKREALVANEKVASQSAEMQQLHEALAEARREARLRGDTAGMPMHVAGRGKLPPPAEAGHPLAKRVLELEQELATVRAELQQASQRSQSKDAELTVANQKLLAAQHANENKDAELAIANHRLHTAQNEHKNKDSDRLQDQRQIEARLDIAEKLSKKRMDLERREEAVAAREAALEAAARRHDMNPAIGQVHVPPFYGSSVSSGSGVPQPGGGGFAGFLKRVIG
jgi:hypothetical protein|mmetsp:Transcript_18284/g.29718  ORF Transcript_18284/g.29718 Transcript_18284/m.29718 type:complete len:574 (+) Transcript_18284:54-1775(+)